TVGKSVGTTVTHGQSTSCAKSEGEGDTNTRQVDRRGVTSTSKQKNHGKTMTVGESGSTAQSDNESESQTKTSSQGGSSSTSKSHGKSVDLRQETAIYSSEFMDFPDPAKTRIVRVVAHVPSLGTWQADMSLD